MANNITTTIEGSDKKQLTSTQLRNKALEELAEESARAGFSIATAAKDYALFPAVAGAIIGYFGGGIGGMLIGAKQYVVGFVPLSICAIAIRHSAAYDIQKNREWINAALYTTNFPIATIVNDALGVALLSLFSAGVMHVLGFDVSPLFCAKTGLAFGVFEGLRNVQYGATLKQKLSSRIESLKDEQEYLPEGIDVNK